MSPRTGKVLAAGSVAAALAVMALLAFYYYGHDPTATPSPKCMFKVITGWDCPGCGSQRAFHAILHGNVSEAWHFNPFVFFAVPAAFFYITVEAMRTQWPKFHAKATHPLIILAIAVGALAFMILRNVL